MLKHTLYGVDLKKRKDKAFNNALILTIHIISNA